MYMSLQTLMRVAIGIVAAVGLISVASPTTDLTSAASQGCRLSPTAGVVRLIVTPGSVAAGGAAHFRIDNSKGPTLTYGAGYSIQQCVSGVWKLAPFSPTAFTKQRTRQRPSHGRWRGIPIAPDATTGKYRIRKSVEIGMRAHWLYANFTIASHTRPIS
jgi:hypothetical protein